MQQQQGLTFRELVRYFGKRWLLGIISFLVIGAISFGALFMTQKKTSNYKSTFMLSFKYIENNKYPDGTFFSFKQIIGRPALEETKNSSDQFETVDIDKMVKDNAFSIENTEITTNLNHKMYSLTFELKVPASYFVDEVQATAFVKKLVESQTYEKVDSYYDNFKLADFLSDIDDDTDYLTVLSKIDETLNLYTSELRYAIDSTHRDFVYDEVNHKTLSQLFAEWRTYVRALNLDAIENDFNTHVYDRKNKDTDEATRVFEAEVQDIIAGLEEAKPEIEKARNNAEKETNFIFYEDNNIITKFTTGMSVSKQALLGVAIGLVGAIILVSCYGAYEDFAPVKSERKPVGPRFGKREVKVPSTSKKEK